MKNKLIDLNNHLFAQLERLCDEDLTKDELSHEIKRASAISNISKNIIENGRLAVEAQKLLKTDGIKAPALLNLGFDEQI